MAELGVEIILCLIICVCRTEFRSERVKSKKMREFRYLQSQFLNVEIIFVQSEL